MIVGLRCGVRTAEIKLFDLIDFDLIFSYSRLSMLNLTSNKRNKRLQKFNGSYQALAKFNALTS